MIKLNLKQLSPEVAENSSETTVATNNQEQKKVEIDYQAFETPEQKLEKAFTTTSKPGETTKTANPPIEKKEDAPVVEATENKTEVKITPDNDKKSEGSETETSVLRFKEDLTLGKEGELTITSLAKELGMEVKEENFASFKTAYEEKVEAIRKEAKEGNFMSELEKQPIEAQEAFLLAKSGKSIFEIEQPVLEINSHLAKQNYDLVKSDLEAQGMGEEAVNEKLEQLTESGKIDKTGEEIRVDLNQVKDQKIKERTDFFNNLKTQEQNRVKEESKKIYSVLETELKATKEFMGFPLPDTTKDAILKRFQDGKYDDMKMPNSKKFLNAILHEELSGLALNELKQKVQSKVYQKTANELHNIPPLRQDGEGKPNDVPKDVMDKLEEQFGRQKK